MRKIFMTMMVCSTVLGFAVSALAGDGQIKAVEQRLGTMEKSVQDLQAAFRQQGEDIAQKMAAVDQMRADWNGYQGTVDSISQQQQLLLDQLKKYIDEFDGRLRSLEQKVGKTQHADNDDPDDPNKDPVASTAAKNPSAFSATTTSVASEAAVGVYQQALSAVRTRDYANAISGFRKFLAQTSQGPMAENAQYWIAECLLTQKNYTGAVQEYLALLNNFPHGSKFNTALLHQSAAYDLAGLKKESRQSLLQLVAQAPSSAEGKQAATQLRVLNQNAATAARTAP